MALNKDFKVKNGATITQDLSVGGNAYLNALTGTNATFDKLTATEFEATSAIFTRTIVTSTSALSVINNGTGPALYVRQKGTSQPIAEFVDQEGGVIYFADTGNLGINTKDPNEKLTVSGKVSATGNLSALRVAVCNTSYGGFISGGRDLADIFATTASSGSVCGSGTTGRITKWSSSSTLTDSIAREAGSQFTIDGSLSATSNLSAAGNATISGNVSAAGNLSGYNVNPRGDIFLDEDQRIYFENDHATWIESHAADSFRIVAGGNQMLLLDYDTGNRAVFGNGTKVFIGSNNNALPEEALTVQGNMSASGGLSAAGPNYNYLEGRLGINTNRPDYMLDVAGSVGIGACLIHNNDDDTFIHFTEDDINIQAGGVNFIDITQDTASEITFNEAGADVDFRVEGAADNGLLYTDAGTNKVGIGTRTPNEKLTVAGNISACNTVQACSISANSTNGGIVSAGRDLADIFVTTSGNVDGSGTANFLPSWSDSNTLTNSIACQTSTQLTVAGNVSACGGLSATEMNSYFACNVGIGTNTPDHALDVAGTMGINSYLYHNDDNDTHLLFGANSINLVAGGKSALKYDASSSKIVLNNTNANVDVHIMADDGEEILATDAANNRVGINTTTPNEAVTIKGNLSATGTLSAERAAVCNSSYGGFISGGRDLADIFATSAGNVDGSGTANFLPLWSDSNTLTNSIACQPASNLLTVKGNVSACGGLSATQMNNYFGCYVGIGTNRPGKPLHVNDDDSVGGICVTGASLLGTFERDIGTSGLCVSILGSNADPQIRYNQGVRCWVAGVDQSADSFVIADGAEIHTGDYKLEVGTGQTTIHGNVSACGGLSATEAPNYFACNVGINTNWPTSYLQVSALKTIDRDLVVICGGGSGGDYDGLRVEAGNGTHLFRVNQLTYDVLTPSTGKVGIGNTAPDQKLTVSGNVSACGGLSATEGVGYFACNVGIGTNEPSELLHVQGNNATVNVRESGAATVKMRAGSIGRIGTYSNDDFSIVSNSTDQVRIKSDGKVGIGNTAPGEKLTVSGNISACGGLSATQMNSYFGCKVGIGTCRPDQELTVAGNLKLTSTYPRIFLQDTNNDSDFSIINNDGSFGIYDDTNTTYRASITPAGNFGIGTTAPNEKLTVAGNVSACGVLSAADAIRVPDSTCITLGNSEDLKLYHDGSNSYINETGTGDLYICGGNDIIFKDAVGNLLANMNQSNSVELYYGGSKKFETTNTGSKTSGSICATNDLNVDGDASVRALTVTRGASVTRGVSASSTHNGFVSAGRDLADIFATTSGNVDGSGTKFKIPQWNDTDTLGDSPLSAVDDGISVAATKKIYLNKTEDTYIDSDSTDRLRAVAGGQQMLVLDYDTGNRAAFGDTKVAIGGGDNALPDQALTVAGNISACGGLSATKGVGYFGCKVGIGTCRPETSLDIYSSVDQQTFCIEGSNSSVTPTARIRTISTGSVLLLETATASDSRDILKAKNSSGAVFNLQADGKLGIGTEVPNETLTVAGNISACNTVQACSISANSTNGGIVSAGRDLADVFTACTGTIDGSGTTCHVPQFTDADTIGNSCAYFNSSTLVNRGLISGSNICIGGDVPTNAVIGQSRIGNYVADNAYFSHFDNGTSANYAVKQNANGATGLNSKSGQILTLNINNDPQLTVNADCIGIGTTGPAQKLHLEFANTDTSFSGGGGGAWGGEGLLIENTSSNTDTMAMIQLRTGDADIHIAGIRQGTDDNDLGLFFEASEKVRFTHDGDVGIGTTAPNEKLTVAGNISADGNMYITANDPFIYMTDDSGSTYNAAWKFQNNCQFWEWGGGKKIYFDSSSGIRLGDWGAGTGTLATTRDPRIGKCGSTFGGLCFTTGNSTRMVIQSAGNVGIGTDSPNEKLTVAGNISACNTVQACSVSANSTNGGFVSAGRDLADIFATTSGNVDGTGTKFKIPQWTDTDTLGDSAISAIDNGLYIDGCVGIGTSTPNHTLDVEESGASMRLRNTATDATTQFIMRSGGSAGQNQIIFGDDDDANIGMIRYRHNGDSLAFDVSDSEAMRILSDGKVGIGTTTPNEKLTVAGNISACNTVQACSVSANSTNGGFVSAGRDLADIFATSSGNVDGTGTKFQIPQWNDTDTLGDSPLSATNSGASITRCDDVSTLTLHRDGSNPGTNTVLSRIKFDQDYGGTQQNWAKIDLCSNDSSTRTDMDFYVKSVSGALCRALTLHGGSSNEGTSVGIGASVTDPGPKLTVGGNLSACGGLSATEMNSYFACKVGIGTNIPDYNLHIERADTTGPTIQLQNSEYCAWINAWGSGGPAGRASRFEINAGSTNFAVGADTIRFQIGNVGDSCEKMRIDATGCVGIGTCAPQSLLHVSSGDIRIDNNCQYLAETASGGTIGVAKIDGSDNLYIGDCNIKIDVSGTTPRMTIGTDSCACGFVGIGNDDSGCPVTPNERLTVGGAVSASGNGYFACVIAGGYFEQKAANDTLACYPTGTLVVIGECGDLIQSTRENDKKVFGVTQNGVCQPIVLGAEPVLVTGDIKIGDYITTSDKPGHGKKTCAPVYGSVIAQSMEAGTGDSHLVKAMIRKM